MPDGVINTNSYLVPVNRLQSSHFQFLSTGTMGVVAMMADESSALLGFSFYYCALFAGKHMYCFSIRKQTNLFYYLC